MTFCMFQCKHRVVAKTATDVLSMLCDHTDQLLNYHAALPKHIIEVVTATVSVLIPLTGMDVSQEERKVGQLHPSKHGKSLLLFFLHTDCFLICLRTWHALSVLTSVDSGHVVLCCGMVHEDAYLPPPGNVRYRQKLCLQSFSGQCIALMVCLCLVKKKKKNNNQKLDGRGIAAALSQYN